MIEKFSTVGGISLLDPNFDSGVDILHGNGVPGGDTGEQDAAPIGSLYLQRNATIYNTYVKIANNGNTNDWIPFVTKDIFDNYVQNVPFRFPVTVVDPTSYANVGALPLTGVVDGVTLSVGDRVLFTGLSGTQSQIATWDGSAWLIDSSPDMDGDVVFVQQGTEADTIWGFDGTNWVKMLDKSTLPSVSDIEQYIGKPSGSANPNYTNTNIVTQGSDLTTAISDLDGAVANIQQTLQPQSVTNVTTTTVIDSVPITGSDVIEWRIGIVDAATPSKRLTTKVVAMYDGVGTVKFTKYSTIKSGGINGVTLDVVLNGGNIELTVQSTDAVNVKAVRLTSFDL
jgi:hypothetical protein